MFNVSVMKKIKNENINKYEKKCEAGGCEEAGSCRAPKDRTLREYYWFCPKHAREYNEKWDYYQGMSPAEIEANLREDVVWHRPTWNFASRRPQFHDPFNIQKDIGVDFNVPLHEKEISPEALNAMKILDLQEPLAKQKIKNRYRELAKKYHPDINGGDKKAEDRFKEVSAAYMILIKLFK